MPQYQGKIRKVYFTGSDSYAIVRVSVNGVGTITACGTFDAPVSGAAVKMTGTFKFNKKYGERQLYVTSSESAVKLTHAEKAAIEFLADNVNGVGPATATDLVSKFGADLLKYVEDGTDDQFETIKGINPKKHRDIIAALKDNPTIFELYRLTSGKITSKQADKIYKAWGDEAVDKLRTNPYELIYDEEIDGFAFKKTDQLAKKMGIQFDTYERVAAGMDYCLQDASASDGDVYLPADELKDRAMSLLFTTDEIKEVYFTEILKTSVPDDNAEWEKTALGRLESEHLRTLQNLVAGWDDEITRDKYIKQEKLSTEEVDTVDLFVKKKNVVEAEYDNILMRCSRDVTHDGPDAYKHIPRDLDVHMVRQMLDTGIVAVYDIELYKHECYVAERLAHLSNETPGVIVLDEDIENAIAKAAAEDGAILNKEQQEAVRMAVKSKVSIITGGPGRGKTTVLKAAIATWLKGSTDTLGSRPLVVLLAPTGKAANRMYEQTGIPASTIHRKLAMWRRGSGKDDDESGITPVSDSMLPDKDTLIFVDESSMMDNKLIWKLLKASRDASICFVGDVDQLPSIGPGQVLSDMIDSGKIPCTYLIQCYRASGSILDNSDIINTGGRLRDFKYDMHFEGQWLSKGTAKATAQRVIIQTYLKKVEKYGPAETVILTPMRKGPTGVTALNNEIQKEANPPAPGKEEIRIRNKDTDFGKLFREGDRVLHTKNNYHISGIKDSLPVKGVFNGETGTIQKIKNGFDGKTIEVLFDDGKVAEYSTDDAQDLTLAYAMTCHKAQGSEYKCVIVSMSMADRILLSRKLLYTAESRAKDLCVFIGESYAFQLAISDVRLNGQDTTRNTLLAERIQEFCNAR